ncbi:MAG: hypothetical protein ABSA79_11745 [Candidatus Bathyarchaeia archaeon]|jgi:hypothetical protein
MSTNENDYLKKFYSLLRDNFLREKNLKEKSILISFIETKSSSRNKLLSDSTMPSNLIPNEALLSLLTKKQIQVLGNVGTYAITAKGVWDYEQNFGLVSEETLFSYINEKFFSGASSSSNRDDLDDREAVILFAMIAARAFSEKSLVDLKKDDNVKEKWREVLEKSYDLLTDLHLIRKLKKEDFLRKSGNEHVVSSIFRHNGPAVQKTRGIYVYTGRYGYYLDIFGEDVLSKEKLSYLFWKIFKGSLSSDSADLILQFCKEISSKESIYLYDDIKEHNFSIPMFDYVVKDSLLDSVLSKAKWAKV